MLRHWKVVVAVVAAAVLFFVIGSAIPNAVEPASSISPTAATGPVKPPPCRTIRASKWNSLVRTERRLDGRSRPLKNRPVCVVTYKRFKKHVRRVQRESMALWLASFTAQTASWYGPGFYGNRTACGQTYSQSIIGVAHKTLPCGTIVYFRNGKKFIAAPVIDRGPYVAGRTWDLSAALKQSFGFDGVGTVWTTIKAPPR